MTAGTGGSAVQAVLARLLDRRAAGLPVVPARDARLASDLGLDSLSMIDLAVAAEDAFGIRIPDDDLEHFVTFGDVADYVQRAMP